MSNDVKQEEGRYLTPWEWVMVLSFKFLIFGGGFALIGWLFGGKK